jgi:hypothetical protein
LSNFEHGVGDDLGAGGRLPVSDLLERISGARLSAISAAIAAVARQVPPPVVGFVTALLEISFGRGILIRRSGFFWGRFAIVDSAMAD